MTVNAAMYDVLVIGAGAAGLTAGRMLAAAGRRVAIVEARDRVGGRIWTHRIAGAMPVELGAEFIHGLPQASWTVAREAALKTYELDGAQVWFADGQLSADGGPQGDSRQVLEGTSDWVGAHARDMSFAAYLKMSGADVSSRESAANYVEGFNAADRNRIGIAALARQQRAEDAIEADRLFRVEEGYDAVPHFLLQKFTRAGGDLILGAPARAIVWQRGDVVVHIQDRSGTNSILRAQRTVITVPLGVLQSGALEITPRPVEALLQANRLVMGPVVRVTLVFKRRFWIDSRLIAKSGRIDRELANLSFLFTPSELPATWWTPMPREFPVITAWLGGPRAEVLQRMIAPDGDQQAIVNRCLATLSTVFNVSTADLENLLVSWHAHDWQRDEYARGAYSYVPAGALDAPERLGRPVENTLYFAGEHTDTSGHWGTVHAALATGERAASQVVNSD